jgi:RNase adapter protein RapZ
VTLTSFAFPAGLPRDADMVFDARFLRNPHYVTDLKPRTGRDPEVAAYIEADPDFAAFFARVRDLLGLLLPRFVQEGKKYANIAIGCTGGRHRSVHIVEKLTKTLTEAGWRVTTTHRELARAGETPAPIVGAPSVQAQEA